MIEERVAAVFGGLGDLGVDVGRDGHPVRTADTGIAQHVDGAGDGRGVPVRVGRRAGSDRGYSLRRCP